MVKFIKKLFKKDKRRVEFFENDENVKKMYPLVNSLGVQVLQAMYSDTLVVKVEDLENALKTAPEVYKDQGFHYWGTHKTVGKWPLQARVVCVQVRKKDL